MKKKTILSFLLTLFLLTTLFGQQKNSSLQEDQSTLVVSSISGGECFLQKGKKRLPVTSGTSLSSNDIIVMEAGSTMIAVEPAAVLRYTFKGAYTGTIRNYVKQNEQNCVKSISLKYVDYLLAQAFKKVKSNPANQEDNEATVFRKVGIENDSMTLSLKTIDSLYHTIDSLSPPVQK